MNKLERILHVDDDPSIRIIAGVALEKLGHFDLLSCSSGAEALEKAPGFQPQVLLLDIMMPEMDGPTTLAELKKVMDLTDVLVLFMTAKVQPDEMERYQALGAFEVISKPFEPMKLSKDIQQMWETFHDR